MSNNILKAIEEATENLLYLSESDEPFETVHWRDVQGSPHGEGVRRLGCHTSEEPIAEMSLEEFFRPLTKEKRWHREDEKEDVRRYRKLEETLKAHLSSVKVFRIGRIEMYIYIVGTTPEGDWAGIRTKAVET